MNANRRPISSATSWNGDPLLAHFGELADDEERRRRTLLGAAAAAVALHVLLVLVVPVPRHEGPPALAPRAELLVLAPTPRFRKPPPPAPVAAPVRRVPVPDPTPDEIEPLRTIETPPPQIVVPIDTSALAIPDAPPPAEPAYYEVRGEVLKPVQVYAPSPPYPRTALLARKEGTVVLDAIIDREGRVTSLRALTSIGFGLEEAALATVREWRFRPGTRRGEPVPVRYQLSVQFRMGR